MAGIKQIKRPNKRVREVEEPQDIWLNELIDDYLQGTCLLYTSDAADDSLV